MPVQNKLGANRAIGIISMMLMFLSATCALHSQTAFAGIKNAGVRTEKIEDSVFDTHASSVKAWPKLNRFLPHDALLEKRVAQVVSKMTLEQKIGQMIQGEIRWTTPEDVRKYHLGSILNGGGAFPNNDKYASLADWVKLADDYYNASIKANNLNIPIIWGTDAVHGHSNVVGATIFPHNIGLGAANNPGLIKSIAAATAKEVSATAIDWNFAPTLAVAQDLRWGRTYESFSQNPSIVQAYASAMVEGFQGEKESFLTRGKIVATAKHFIADGGTALGDDQGNAKVSQEELIQLHARGFFSAIEAGVQTVMVSYSSVNDIRMHTNTHLIKDILKGQLGFDGLVVSDWNGIGQVPGCANNDCAASVNAGIDMLMVPEKKDWLVIIQNLKRQVRAGEITMARIDDAVTRILRVKMRAGLFDNGRPSLRHLTQNGRVVGADKHREIARKAVRESLVLLKNNQNILPLDPARKYAVLGSGANSVANQSGGWTISWQGTGNTNADFPGATSIYGGIKKIVEENNGTVTLFDGNIKGANKIAEGVTAIVVMSEEPYAEYLGDIQNLDTLEFQQDTNNDLQLLNTLKQKKIPTVVVLLSGRPVWATPHINRSDAFVVAWLPGTQGGGVAEVLFSTNTKGQYDFVGRLPFIWPRHPCQAHVGSLGDKEKPLYEVGFGLTYKDKINTPTLDETNVQHVLGCHRVAGENNASQAYATANFVTKSASGNYKPIGQSRSMGLVVKNSDNVFRAQWLGTDKTQLVLKPNKLTDLVPNLAANDALTFDVARHSELAGPVFLSVACQLPCKGELELTPKLNSEKLDQWQTLAVDLSCLAKKGADLRKLSSLFAVHADDNASLSFRNVRLAKRSQLSAKPMDCK